jgi:hypothetical protein
MRFSRSLPTLRSRMIGSGSSWSSRAQITMRDRNPWYREVARLKGPLCASVAAAVGAAYVDKNIRT